MGLRVVAKSLVWCGDKIYKLLFSLFPMRISEEDNLKQNTQQDLSSVSTLNSKREHMSNT